MRLQSATFARHRIVHGDVRAVSRWGGCRHDLGQGGAVRRGRNTCRPLVGSSTPIARPASDVVEHTADDWIAATLAGLAEVLDGAPGGSVAGVGVCSQVNTHVFVDERGEALAPAIVWQDGRAADDAARLDLLVPESARIRWWGSPLPIDASHVLSRMAWMARVRPDIWRRTRWVMAPKDYCLLKLTGEASADPLSSFGVVDASLRYIDDLVAIVPGAAARLPPLKGPAEIVGSIRDGLPGAGLPVVTATMDAWAAMLGASAAREGAAVTDLSGTSEVGGIVSGKRNPTPGVIRFPKCLGIRLACRADPGGRCVRRLAWRNSRPQRRAVRSSPRGATLRGRRRPSSRTSRANARLSGISPLALRFPGSTDRWERPSWRAPFSRASPIRCGFCSARSRRRPA